MGAGEHAARARPRTIPGGGPAGGRELPAKASQAAIARETLTCLVLNSDHYTQRYTSTELAIVTAASLAYHIIVREGLPAGFATGAVDPAFGWKRQIYLPPPPGPAHLIPPFEVLPRRQTAPARPLAAVLS